MKAKLYAKASVQDYWIVNIPDRRLEIFRAPFRLRYQNVQTLSPGEEARLLASPDVTLQVTTLFASIALTPALPAGRRPERIRRISRRKFGFQPNIRNIIGRLEEAEKRPRGGVSRSS